MPSSGQGLGMRRWLNVTQKKKGERNQEEAEVLLIDKICVIWSALLCAAMPESFLLDWDGLYPNASIKTLPNMQLSIVK